MARWWWQSSPCLCLLLQGEPEDSEAGEDVDHCVSQAWRKAGNHCNKKLKAAVSQLDPAALLDAPSIGDLFASFG